jgi:hypothetical protein
MVRREGSCHVGAGESAAPSGPGNHRSMDRIGAGSVEERAGGSMAEDLQHTLTHGAAHHTMQQSSVRRGLCMRRETGSMNI